MHANQRIEARPRSRRPYLRDSVRPDHGADLHRNAQRRHAGREDVRTLLIGMIGCNIAWGLVDAVMYPHERPHGARPRPADAARRPRRPQPRCGASGHQRCTATHAGAATFPRSSGDAASGPASHAEPPPAPKLTAADWMGASGVFLLVFLSTLPLAVPFLLFSEVRLALRTSNLIAIVMLFVNGYVLAQYSGYRPFRDRPDNGAARGRAGGDHDRVRRLTDLPALPYPTRLSRATWRDGHAGARSRRRRFPRRPGCSGRPRWPAVTSSSTSRDVPSRSARATCGPPG